MNVLFLSQGKKIESHPGWHDAFEQLQNEGIIDSFLNIPYLGYAEIHGWKRFYDEVISLCKIHKFDIVYFHHFHHGKHIKLSPLRCINEILQLDKRPIVITSVGDPFSDNWMLPHYPEYFKDASRLSNITFSTQMGNAAEMMINWGTNNVVLSPLGICQKRFKSIKRVDNSNKKYDIVFIGNSGLTSFNPLSKIWWCGKKRSEVVQKLHTFFKGKFGLYGDGWDLNYSNGPIHFDLQQETFKNGRFAIDAPPRSYSDYYSSNRHLFQIASGAPTIMFETPRIKKLYRENEHCYYVAKEGDFISRIEEILKISKEELQFRANNAANYILENHTQYHRLKFKIDTVKRYIANNFKLDVKFPFFLPEVDIHSEIKFATRTRMV